MGPLPPTADDRAVWDTWMAVYRLPVLTVADEVGTFRSLSGRPQATEELAHSIQVDARALGIHLGLLAALGYVERHDSRWRATAMARAWLHPEAEGYFGPVLQTYRESQPLHAQLLATLRPQFRADAHASAVAEWERGEMPPGLAEMIGAYMNACGRAAAIAAARQGLFSDVDSLLDVGGGSGLFSIEMARAWPRLSATVLEIPAVCEVAQRYIAASGLQGRVRAHPGNMFTRAWPTGHALHLLSNIFHDWSDDTCRLLARQSFAALPPGGRIVLHEMLMDDDGCGPLTTAAFSILMLLGTRGKQYTLSEFRDILADAGFQDVDAFTTGGGYYSLVVAHKPGA